VKFRREFLPDRHCHQFAGFFLRSQQPAHIHVLGACAAHHHELQHILQHANVSDYTSSPEQADKLAADFSTKLQYQCLKNKIKSKKFSSIAEMKNLKMQIYEIDRKRSMTLLEE